MDDIEELADAEFGGRGQHSARDLRERVLGLRQAGRELDYVLRNAVEPQAA